MLVTSFYIQQLVTNPVLKGQTFSFKSELLHFNKPSYTFVNYYRPNKCLQLQQTFFIDILKFSDYDCILFLVTSATVLISIASTKQKCSPRKRVIFSKNTQVT